MSVPAESQPGRRPVMIPFQLHERLLRIRDNWYSRTGRAPTFAEVIERALDRAQMEEDQ
jgi:hypothetical protein